MKHIFIFCMCAALHLPMLAQNFNDYFEDKTLRTDYIFTGDAQKQEVYLDELSSLPQWAGRRHHLSELPLAGNGQITMKDKATGKIIYRTSFSSLFQEWLGEEEATRIKKGFENSFLLPFPKQEAIVTVELMNAQREVSASLSHEVRPNDILIHDRGTARITPHRYLHQGGDSKNCIDVAILAEGYTEAEMDLFYKDAEATCEALFDHEPFKQLKERFNIVAVASPSDDSGVSIPRKDEWKSTAVNSHFDTFYSDRYLTTNRVKSIHNWLAGIPYEHIIILANTNTYGGGGIYNSYTLTTTHNPMFKPVVVHEFGHSFGGLADEYAY
ncbi:MAG: peptidase M64, partial [Bacteroidaceae bacterium]|nr:peptidase M64 [Bacteroidaceae bacterium]